MIRNRRASVRDWEGRIGVQAGASFRLGRKPDPQLIFHVATVACMARLDGLDVTFDRDSSKDG